MRAFLILLNTWTLVAARLPYIKSSGYYNPFPPKTNQIMYEFEPLSHQNQPPDADTKTRATRDLAWREFDAFISGTEEPSCADLRRMWRLAKELQQKAIESNDIPQEMHPHPFQAASYMARQENSSPKSSQSKALQPSKFSSTSEVEVPLEQNSETSSTKQSRDRPNSDSSAEDEADRNDDGIVYGIVKTHAPAQAPQVRDPTKEILRGLWGHGSESNRVPGGHRGRPQYSYGRIHTHQKQSESDTQSPFQNLQDELFGPRKDNSKNTDNVFGTVHRFSPNSNSGEDSVSRLDQVRSLLNHESRGGSRRNGDFGENLVLDSSSSSSTSSKNAFDRIREKLLNTRARERFRMSRERNLRRKGSKKRRRNAEEVALIKERLLKNYIHMLPDYASSIDAAKKRRRRRKNQGTKSISKSESNMKKWRISKEKIREQNLLLKKLGK